MRAGQRSFGCLYPHTGVIHHPWQKEDDDIAPWENLICSPKIAEDDKMAIVIHWSSVRGFGILRSQVHGEVPGDEGAG